MGFLPLVLGNIALDMIAPEITDLTIDLLEYLAVNGYVLVRKGGEQAIKGAKQVWDLAEPIKKPIGKISNSVKNNTIKGWNKVAPIIKPAASNIKNGTIAGWKYITPKVGKGIKETVRGW